LALAGWGQPELCPPSREAGKALIIFWDKPPVKKNKKQEDTQKFSPASAGQKRTFLLRGEIKLL